MTPSRENEENESTAISNEASRPVESLSLPQQHQRRSARRRSIHPKFMEAAANDSMTPIRRKLANNEEKAQAVVPVEKTTAVSAADVTPRKPANKKEPSTSTRKSTRNSSTAAATNDKPPTPLSTRKCARKRGKVETDEESKIVASSPPSLSPARTERVGLLPPSALRSARKPQPAKSALAKPEDFACAATRTDSLSQEFSSGITAVQINETAQKLFESEEFQILDRVRTFSK